MPFIFVIPSGRFYQDGAFQGTGYSGNGPDLDNPADETVVNHGPLPEGKYTIGAPKTPIDHLGPLALPLTPQFQTGRSDIFIHGDNAAMNHTGSDGCLILAHAIRQAIVDSGDDELIVVA